jgi:hypothetical protein
MTTLPLRKEPLELSLGGPRASMESLQRENLFCLTEVQLQFLHCQPYSLVGIPTEVPFWWITKGNSSCHVRLEVFTMVTMKNAIFLDVTPCDSCKNQRFGGMSFLQEPHGILDSSCLLYSGLILKMWCTVQSRMFNKYIGGRGDEVKVILQPMVCQSGFHLEPAPNLSFTSLEIILTVVFFFPNMVHSLWQEEQ